MHAHITPVNVYNMTVCIYDICESVPVFVLYVAS